MSQYDPVSVAQRITFFVESGAARRARLNLIQLHPADQADVLAELDSDVLRLLLDNLTPNELATTAEYFSDDLRKELFPALGEDRLVTVLGEMKDDIAADVLQTIPEDERKQILERLGDAKVEELVGYEEESAGGRMSADVVLLRDFWTVARSIEHLRRIDVDLRNQLSLFVINEYNELVGSLTPGHLVMFPGPIKLDQIMEREPVRVQVGYDQEEAAERMRHYNLLSLPVVDENGHVRGVLTADDVLDIQVEEATEDIYKMVGLNDEESIFRPIRHSVPPRLGWLSINLVTAFLGALTVSLFEGTIEKVAALAVFMPMVAGMGGNAGIQTITLVVRSMAVGEITAADGMAVLRHELIIALIKGACIGLVVALIAVIWRGNTWFGLVVGVAMFANIVNASLVGVVVPLVLKALHADPALAAGVFVTTFSDVVGFVVFLGLATLLISHLT